MPLRAVHTLKGASHNFRSVSGRPGERVTKYLRLAIPNNLGLGPMDRQFA